MVASLACRACFNISSLHSDSVSSIGVLSLFEAACGFSCLGMVSDSVMSWIHSFSYFAGVVESILIKHYSIGLWDFLRDWWYR